MRTAELLLQAEKAENAYTALFLLPFFCMIYSHVYYRQVGGKFIKYVLMVMEGNADYWLSLVRGNCRGAFKLHLSALLERGGGGGGVTNY